MAYGNRDTSLQNFEVNIDEATFMDLTSISIEEFKKLRDGFTYLDEETGVERQVPGLFDELVFNSSVQKFFKVKDRLADYFNNEGNEDIFDYIPPQKTNQIFTPRRVVNMMLDTLESNVADIFKDKNRKFVDPYVKSGLFLAEIAKRLFTGLKDDIPFEEERIKWIFEKQLYGFAPSNIIYNIAKNFVYGEFDYIRKKNLIECDLVPVVEAKKLEEKIKEVWGDSMKFDVVIGNPPYQESIENRGEQLPLYHKFYSEAIKIASITEFITPSRFLFNVGKTPKEWNEFMLNSPYFKVEYYYPSSKDIFSSVDIKGGVAITIYNKNTYNDPIREFIPNKIVKIILNKVKAHYEIFQSMGDILFSNTSYRYSKTLFNEHPEFIDRVSGGSARYLASSSLQKLNEMFTEIKPTNEEEFIGVWGRVNNKRVLYYTKKKYLITPDNSKGYKVFVPSSMGSGEYGEILSEFIIGEPNVGATETFISFGNFKKYNEAKNLSKYLITKFARLLLSTRKVTQGNKTAEVWSNIPLQDFTSNSDIDWSKSIEEIDEQLFDKYGLTEEEREHIKKSIKTM